MALAGQIKRSGLDLFIAQQLHMGPEVSIVMMIFSVTLVIVFLTEITSNTATAAGFLPLLGPVALGIGLADPSILVIPAALAASCAFMMPVATPPNAIVFSSGQLHIMDMVKAGFMLNLIAVGTDYFCVLHAGGTFVYTINLALFERCTESFSIFCLFL